MIDSRKAAHEAWIAFEPKIVTQASGPEQNFTLRDLRDLFYIAFEKGVAWQFEQETENGTERDTSRTEQTTYQSKATTQSSP